MGNSEKIFAEYVVSVSDVKRNPTNVGQSSNGNPIAVLNHNKVAFYIVPPETWESIYLKDEMESKREL